MVAGGTLKSSCCTGVETKRCRRYAKEAYILENRALLHSKRAWKALEKSPVIFERALLTDTWGAQAHTCFFTIDLPQYSAAHVMREKLLYAIHNCSSIDKVR